MNKLLLFFFGFLLGGIVVYVVGDFFPRIIIQHTTVQKEVNNAKTDSLTSKKQGAKKKNSIIESIEKSESSKEVNSLEKVVYDSILPLDTIVKPDVEFEVVRDRLIARKPIILQQFNAVKDTSATGLIADKVSEDYTFNKKLAVEYWESPIDFLGYKLNKNQLILYGISPQEPIELIYRNSESLIMLIDNKEVILVKTEKYKSLNF